MSITDPPGRITLYFPDGTRAKATIPANTPYALWCPECGHRHIDEGHWATRSHRTHRCVDGPELGPDGVERPGKGCGHEWRPHDYPTVGVRRP
jgi:hypothetical protein